MQVCFALETHLHRVEKKRYAVVMLRIFSQALQEHAASDTIRLSYTPYLFLTGLA